MSTTFDPTTSAGVSAEPQDTNWPPLPADHLLQFFAYAHLPVPLQAVSKPFCDLANEVATALPSNSERAMALRKLLEAKDCAVRAVLYK